jgi:hypothetical protein
MGQTSADEVEYLIVASGQTIGVASKWKLVQRHNVRTVGLQLFKMRLI